MSNVRGLDGGIETKYDERHTGVTLDMTRRQRARLSWKLHGEIYEVGKHCLLCVLEFCGSIWDLAHIGALSKII